MPLLAAYMDVQAAYGSGVSGKETASFAVKGLRAETQIVAGSKGAAADAAMQVQGGVVRRGAGITQVRSSINSAIWALLSVLPEIPIFIERILCDA